MSDNCEFAGQRHGDIQLYATCQLAGRLMQQAEIMRYVGTNVEGGIIANPRVP